MGYLLRMASIYLDDNPCSAAKWMSLPSKRNTQQNRALQSRAALVAMVSNTGWTSFGELAMTRSTSEVGGGETAMPRGRWRISGLTLRRLTAAFFHCCDAHRCASVASSPATGHRF